MKKIIFISIVSLFISTSLIFAQNESPINSNYLYEHGVSPRILDAAASDFLQDGSFEYNLRIIENKNGKNDEFDLTVIYDPAYKYGMDVRIVINTDSLDKKTEKGIKKIIELTHRFSRMSRHNLYDESTLKMVKNEGGEVVLEFYYQKNDIEPYLKGIKKLKGEIYFIDGQLDKVVLTNTKPLKNKVVEYEKVVRFSKTDQGGFIVKNSVINATVSKKGKEIYYTDISTTTNYFNKDRIALSWEGKNEIKVNTISSPDTVSVNLGWKLPLLGKPATKLGYSLPRPVGVNVFSHFQSQNMQFTDLSISVDGGENVSFTEFLDLKNSSVDQNTSIIMAKGDIWLFPFLNINGIVGKGSNRVIGDIKVSPELVQALKDYGWLVGIDSNDVPKSIPINIMVNSIIYGGGLTLAGGINDWNLSLTYQLMVAKMTEANTTTIANVVSPMVGYMTPFGLNLMVGAQGQFYNTAIKGFIDYKDDTGPHKLNYNVNFKPVRWNLMFGLYKGFNKHWEIALQAGIGDRTSATAIFGYRF